MTTLRRLVVVADDGGLARSTDDAILRAANGVVRHAAVVAGAPTAAEFVRRARDAGLVLGWHVNLTEGQALSGVSELTDATGEFPGKDRRWADAPAMRPVAPAIRAELRAQLAWLHDHGVDPAFVNGHNHVHVIPPVLETLVGLVDGPWFRQPCPRRSCPDFLLRNVAASVTGRAPHPPEFVGFAFARTPTREVLRAELSSCRKDVAVEWMTHPGARGGSPFCEDAARGAETELLADPATCDWLRDLGFESVAVPAAPLAWDATGGDLA